jgi:glycosyltransferase involved in cell wall biosynthesis
MNMKHTVSVVISAYNEGKKIDRCLSAVAWADEIIVVDNESTDETREIAQKYTKKIFSKPNNLMLNKNKNFGFEKAKGPWILNLDADEVVTPELRDEIQELLKKDDPAIDGYWMARKNIIFGRWIQHGFWWPDRQLRFFRKNKGKFPGRYIHEYIKVEGASAELKEPCLHYNYESITQYITKLDRCTTSEASEYVADGYAFSWMDAIRFPARDFIKVYFAQGAYKDGLHGFVLSMLQSFYSFVTFTKLWELQSFPEVSVTTAEVKEEVSKVRKETLYWNLTTQIDQATNMITIMWLKVQRKVLHKLLS